MTTKKAYSIESASARKDLAAQNHYYWHKVQPNLFVGYRVAAKGVAGTWCVRLQQGRREVSQSLGKLDDVADKQRFSVAQSKALQWLAQQAEAGGAAVVVIPDKIPLRQVLTGYVAELRKRDDGGKAADSALRTLNRAVVPYVDKDGNEWIDQPVARLKKADFKAWRDWLTALPATRGKNVGQRRAGSSVNRDMTDFRSALNWAAEHHGIADAWSSTLTRDHDAEVAAEVDFLDLQQRQQFLQAAAVTAPELVPLAKMMMTIPVRPGALAGALVRDYDKRSHSLKILKDKCHNGRKIALPPQASALLDEAVKGKTPAAFLFTDGRGEQWTSNNWQRPVKESAEAAGLDMTLYWLRHSRITDLVEAGYSAMQIATIAGTSVKIIEKHYFKQRDEVVRQALAVAGF